METPHGNELAYANLVAAAGSGVIIGANHPGWPAGNHPGALKLASRNLLEFAEGNLWNEFKPGIKRLVKRRILH